jgi:hypothetical protein
MTHIVTTSYRNKRPPRKRKSVALEVPVVLAMLIGLSGWSRH